MKARLILAAAAIFGFAACNNTNDAQRYNEPVESDYPNTTRPETNPTPGQQLDTAIQNTREAARNTGDDIKEFGRDVKDKTKEVGQDIKESAQEAKNKAEKDREVIKRKVDEAKEEMKNN